MVTRLVTAEEALESRKLTAIAFRGSRNLYDETRDELEESVRFTHGLFDDCGKLCASMALLPIAMRLDGAIVPCGGIAGVGTLPEHRAKGYVRSLFVHVFGEMRKSGALLSHLYPFSFAYYRQFGYELACERVELASMPIANLRPGKPSMPIEQFGPGKHSDEPLRACHEAFAAQYNLSLRRTDLQWTHELLRGDPIKDNVYAYIAGGLDNPRGYVIFKAPPGEESTVRVRDIAYDSPETLRSLLALIRGLSAQIRYVTLHLPPDVPLDAVFSDPHEARMRVSPQGMSRVMDVPGVIRLLRAPEEPGEGVLAITDPYIPENEGLWRVSWKDGRVSAEQTGTAPDITLPIGRFTQVAVGYRSLGDMLWHTDAIPGKNPLALAPLLPRKQQYLTDTF